MKLAERLHERIAADGPMSFHAWMEACLYDDQDGYYMRPGRKTGPGSDADFATSPTLHPFLGQALANEIEAARASLGNPADFGVVEFGGGEGDLARAALDAMDEPCQWTHVERSPTHREAQEDSRVTWADAMPDGFVGVIVAHEFLDALPFYWLEKRKGNWASIQWDGHAECYAIASQGAIDCAPLGAPEGQRVAAMTQARQWISTCHQRASKALAIVVDYGAPNVWRRGQGGTVRTFANHQEAGSPYEDPGTKDITASIDFQLLQNWATAAGWLPETLETQEAFLVRHGVLEALNNVDRTTLDGASQYLRLRQMMLPNAMGGAFSVQRLWKR